MVNVKVHNKSNNPLPKYQTPFSAGLDVHAYLQEPIQLQSQQRILVPTGLFIEIPVGYEVQVRPRSGLALKHGITVLNSPGTIDSDYRGEIKVLLINHGAEPFNIINGDRIAQLVLAKHEILSWELSSHLDPTERGNGGYGSSGT
jgi:dUTP pyrophosphatase